jgi:hypothetical protein
MLRGLRIEANSENTQEPQAVLQGLRMRPRQERGSGMTTRPVGQGSGMTGDLEAVVLATRGQWLQGTRDRTTRGRELLAMRS